LRQYQQLYQSTRDNLLQKQEVHEQDQYGLAVYATWSLSFSKLDPSAQSFLQICSILHHTGISEEMFKNAALSEGQLEDLDIRNEVAWLLNQLGKQGSEWNPLVFQGVIRQLTSHSLINFDQQNKFYSIHPLVQHWTHTTIDKSRQFMQKCILTIIGSSVSSKFKTEDFKYRHTLLQHITKCMTLLGPDNIGLSVPPSIALVYHEQGHWREAEELGVAIMEKRRQLLGDDHPDTLKSMEYLLCIYRDQGRLVDAEVLEALVIETRNTMFGV